MILLQILAFGGFAYLVAKTLNLHQEKENEKLKAELIYVKTKRQEEKEKYLDRINMIHESYKNDAFDQFKKGGK